MKPVLLDLYCGAGGAARGYHDAGFEVVGVDDKPQPNYPFEFIQDDALEILAWITGLDNSYLGNQWSLSRFDAIHASPPCQHFTKYGNVVKDIKDRYDDLLKPTRDLLDKTGLPYVIENVERAPLNEPKRLCGSMFDGNGTNDLQRHRIFETNWPLSVTAGCDHSIWPPNRYPGGRWKSRGVTPQTPVRKTVEVGRWNIPLETQKWAMGWDGDVTVRELSEGVPPSYTRYIGFCLRAWLSLREVAA